MTSDQPDAPPIWLPYVAVDDCDVAVARAQKRGGKIHGPPTYLPEVGRVAVLTDPSGATFAVIEPAA